MKCVIVKHIRKKFTSYDCNLLREVYKIHFFLIFDILHNRVKRLFYIYTYRFYVSTISRSLFPTFWSQTENKEQNKYLRDVIFIFKVYFCYLICVWGWNIGWFYCHWLKRFQNLGGFTLFTYCRGRKLSTFHLPATRLMNRLGSFDLGSGRLWIQLNVLGFLRVLDPLLVPVVFSSPTFIPFNNFESNSLSIYR